MNNRIQAMSVDEMKAEIKKYPCKKEDGFVFVSYSHKDVKDVYPIVLNWLYRGYNIYIDTDFEKRSSGDNWVNQMQKAIKNKECKLAVCFKSEDYIFSYAALIELLTMRMKKVCNLRKNDLPIDIVNLNLTSVDFSKIYDTKKNEYKDYFKDLRSNMGESLCDRNEEEKKALEEGLSQLPADRYNWELMDESYELGASNFYQYIAEAMDDWFKSYNFNGNIKTKDFDVTERFKELNVYVDEMRKSKIQEMISSIINGNENNENTVNGFNEEKNTTQDTEEVNSNPESVDKPEPKVAMNDGKKSDEKKLISEPVTLALTTGVDTKIEVAPNAGAKSLHDMLYALMDNLGEYSYRYTNATNSEDKKKYKPDGDNWLYNMVNNEIPPAIYSANIFSDEKYYCKAGCGNGNWATCPWIAVFNRHITCSTTEGVYIVYLLDREKKELYLTLNQGMTSITKMVEEKIGREGRSFIKEEGYNNKDEYIAAILRNSASEIRKEIGVGDFLDESITTNVWQYDVGCICSKKYTLSSLPSNEVLYNDLANMLKLYDTYFEKHRTEYQKMKEIPKKGKKALV